MAFHFTRRAPHDPGQFRLLLCLGAIPFILLAAAHAALAAETIDRAQAAALSGAAFDELIRQELRPWMPDEGERADASRSILDLLESWLGPPPWNVDHRKLAVGLRDQATVLGNQSIAPEEEPIAGIALLLGAALVADPSKTQSEELRRQLQTLSAEAERHLYDRLRSSSSSPPTLTQGELRAFIEGRFDSQVMPYLRDPLWPMLKYPLTGLEYRKVREAVLRCVYQAQFDAGDLREEVLEEAAWVIRRLPGLTAQERLKGDNSLSVQLDLGPPRFVFVMPDAEVAPVSRVYFEDALRRFGFPTHTILELRVEPVIE
jgi:hypothetical protein